MASKVVKLSESDRSLMSLSLRIAAQQYRSNAEYCAHGIKDERLEEQFCRQAEGAMKIAHWIDGCEYVEIGIDAPRDSQ